jgi:hypothetical protein
MVINRMLLFLWLISTFSIPSTDAVAQVKFQDSYPLTGAKQPTAGIGRGFKFGWKTGRGRGGCREFHRQRTA